MARDPDDIRAPHLRRDDFLGAFGVLRRGDDILMVANERHVGGRTVVTWDLPGGQVEAGEALLEALARELDEEIAVAVRGTPSFLFFQEGERVIAGARRYVWRSFFFAVDDYEGEPAASGEVLDLRWLAPRELETLLTAPYHTSFVAWMRGGGRQFFCTWRDPG